MDEKEFWIGEPMAIEVTDEFIREMDRFIRENDLED